MGVKSVDEVITSTIEAVQDATQTIQNSATNTVSGTDNNLDTETYDLVEEYNVDSATETVTTDLASLTEEDLQKLIGSMTQEEYEQFIIGVEDYYDNQLKYLEGILKTDSGEGYQDILDQVNTLYALMPNGSLTRLLSNLSILMIKSLSSSVLNITFISLVILFND